MINNLTYGQFFSQFGSSLLNIAIILWVKEVFDSPLYITLIFILTTSSVALTSIFAGPIVDNRNKLGILTSIDSMGFLFSLFAFLYIYFFSPTNIYILISLISLRILLSILYSFRGPSINSYVAEEVVKEDRQKINSKLFTFTTLAFISSEFLSGYIYNYFGLIPLILLDAITYGLAVLCIFRGFKKRTQTNQQHIKENEQKSYLERSIEGWVYVRKQKSLLYITLVLFCISFFFSPYVVWLPFLVDDVYNLSTIWFGYATGATSLGVFTGGYLSRYVKGKYRFNIAFVSLLVISLSFFIISYFRIPYLLVFLMYLTGIALSLFNVVLATVLQEKTDQAMLGRVFTIINAITIIARPLGKASSGVTLSMFNNDASYCFAISSFFIFAAVLIFFNKEKVKNFYRYN